MLQLTHALTLFVSPVPAESPPKVPYVAPDALDRRGKALYGVPGPGRYEPATSFRYVQYKHQPVTRPGAPIVQTQRVAAARKPLSGSACKRSYPCASPNVLRHRRQAALRRLTQHQHAGFVYGCTRHTSCSEPSPPCLCSLHQLASLHTGWCQTSCFTLLHPCQHVYTSVHQGYGSKVP